MKYKIAVKVLQVLSVCGIVLMALAYLQDIELKALEMQMTHPGLKSGVSRRQHARP